LSRAELKSLFEKLGEKQLRAILYDFYHRMAGDVLIGYFFSGKDTQVIAEKQLHFLMFAMGAETSYEGKSPTTAHLELPPIFSGHFDRRLVILKQTLEAHSVAAEDIRTWIDFENAFRDVLVSQAK
jgi:truncated hemoglobin YjbI